MHVIFNQSLSRIEVRMSNFCNQISKPLNTAEIAKNIGWVKNTRLQWSKLTSTFVLNPHPAVVSEIY